MTSLSNRPLDKNLSQNQPENEDVSNGFWRMAKNNMRLRQRALPIQPRGDRTAVPLSFNQEPLWWSEQAYPQNSIQNLQHRVNLTGTLDVDALVSSLREIVKRHEVLRTTIRYDEGQPVQVIAPAVALELPLVDLQHLDGAAQSTEVQNLALTQAETAFDAIAGSLWRFLLIRLAETEHILLYTVSHLVFDAWSHSVLMRELGALYTAFLTGKPSPLAALPIQYADFANSQHQWFQDGILASQLDYWQHQLAGAMPSLDLPTDHLRPASSVYQPDCQCLALPESLTRAVKALSAEQGVSLYVTLLTAFKILLHHYTGQSELLVSTPVAGRYQSQTRGLIGCFINTLPIRTELEKDSTFKDFLQQVSQVTEGALANPDVPVRKLTESINFSGTATTGTLFILQNVPYPVLELPDLTMSSAYLHRQQGHQEPGNYFDLTLSIQENAGTLDASLAFNAALFTQDRIQRLLGHYQTLLESLVTNPDCPIDSLCILTETERHQLLVEWSDRQVDYPEDTCTYQFVTTQQKNSSVKLQHYLLNPSLQPVPVGVPGEVYVGCAEADRAVFNVSELSADRLISHPFSPDPNARLYRTGDLARYLPDGTLEFWGPSDRQVRIRGFRVHLREIEAVLSQHPGLRQAAVVAQTNESGNPRLIAYGVAAQAEFPKTDELLHYLQQTLPNYMIPAAFVPLESLPQTSDGRIDYAALPNPDQVRSQSTDSYLAPRIELERQLAEIWSEALGIRPIGMRDNFFNMGGNSLLAVQVVAQIEKVCGYQMPVIHFFQAQTIEQLAKMLLSPLLQQDAWSLPWNPLEPVTQEKATPKTTKAPLFILNGGFNQFLSGAIWIAQRLGKEQPCYSLHLRGIDGREAPHDRVEEMAADAIQGIRTVQPEGPYYLVGLCFGGMVAYEMAQQLRRQGQEVALLLVVESASPIPKEKGQDTGIDARLKRIPTPEMFDERTRNNPVLLNVFQAAHQAMATYEAEPYPGKVIVCQASEGTEPEQQDRECYLATWKQLASEVEVHTLPGDHMSLYVEENIWTLVNELKACLVQARSEDE
jgi:thioesterase domain-containing protein